MSIANTIDRITAWTQERICNPVKLKVPPEPEKNDGKRSAGVERKLKEEVAIDGEGYDYKLATPTAFPWIIPTKERLPAGMVQFPSVTVRLGDGESIRGDGALPVEMIFGAWNPGTHGSDIITPQPNGSYKQWTGDEAAKYFERNNHGWRDVWNWVDVALREIESVESIDGIMIDKSTLRFGTVKEDGDMVDFYPFWFARITFDVKTRTARNVSKLNELL